MIKASSLLNFKDDRFRYPNQLKLPFYISAPIHDTDNCHYFCFLLCYIQNHIIIHWKKTQSPGCAMVLFHIIGNAQAFFQDS